MDVVNVSRAVLNLLLFMLMKRVNLSLTKNRFILMSSRAQNWSLEPIIILGTCLLDASL